MAKGDVGGHTELAVDGRLEASECDAKGKLLHAGARKEVGIVVLIMILHVIVFLFIIIEFDVF